MSPKHSLALAALTERGDVRGRRSALKDMLHDGVLFVPDVQLPGPTDIRSVHGQLDALLRGDFQIPYSLTEKGEIYVAQHS